MKISFVVIFSCLALSSCYDPILYRTEQDRIEQYERLKIMRQQREIGRIVERAVDKIEKRRK